MVTKLTCPFIITFILFFNVCLAGPYKILTHANKQSLNLQSKLKYGQRVHKLLYQRSKSDFKELNRRFNQTLAAANWINQDGKRVYNDKKKSTLFVRIEQILIPLTQLHELYLRIQIRDSSWEIEEREKFKRELIQAIHQIIEDSSLSVYQLELTKEDELFEKIKDIPNRDDLYENYLGRAKKWRLTSEYAHNEKEQILYLKRSWSYLMRLQQLITNQHI